MNNDKENCKLLRRIIVPPINQLDEKTVAKNKRELNEFMLKISRKPEQEFVRWLFGLRLLRDKITCMCSKRNCIELDRDGSSPHGIQNGGYLWWSNCKLAKKGYVSIYLGSFFAVTENKINLPRNVLECICHWSRQSKDDVIEKSDLSMLGIVYHYLRCVCWMVTNTKLMRQGRDGSVIELGISRCGLTLSTKKKVITVDLVGLHNRKTNVYQVFCHEPNLTGKGFYSHTVGLLMPVTYCIHHDANVLCNDDTACQSFPRLVSRKITKCDVDDPVTEKSNSKIVHYLEYLRKHLENHVWKCIPTMKQLQLILDELCWREIFGATPYHCFTHIIKHLVYVTRANTKQNSLRNFIDEAMTDSWYRIPDDNFSVFQPEIVIPPTASYDYLPVFHMEDIIKLDEE